MFLELSSTKSIENMTLIWRKTIKYNDSKYWFKYVKHQKKILYSRGSVIYDFQE